MNSFPLILTSDFWPVEELVLKVGEWLRVRLLISLGDCRRMMMGRTPSCSSDLTRSKSVVLVSSLDSEDSFVRIKFIQLGVRELDSDWVVDFLRNVCRGVSEEIVLRRSPPASREPSFVSRRFRFSYEETAS